MLLFKQLTWFILLAFAVLLAPHAYTEQERITLFPLQNYNQSVTEWIPATNPNYDTSLLDQEMQQKRMEILWQHYFGSKSPWNTEHVKRVISTPAPDDLKTLEAGLLEDFSNKNKSPKKIGYGTNFRPYENNWIEAIENNIDRNQFNFLSYHSENKAIAINNLHARVLPTDEPHFYNHQLAGQGYPFDNLQMSSVWAATPLYILLRSKDKAWALVLTPDLIGWVKAKGIATVDSIFANQWTQAAHKNLAAITAARTNITVSNEHLFFAYIGSIFPAEKYFNGLQLMVPTKTAGGRAEIKTAFVNNESAHLIPFTFTPHNVSTLLQSLLGRPYGWGNLYFYNDCSAELKNLFAAFGIWLPRHSSQQISEGKMLDLSSKTSAERLESLQKNGHSFLTIVYVGGHVFLYLGTYKNPDDGRLQALSFQNIWGLRPKDDSMRAVIGESVLFPLLQSYPEDANLVPLTDKSFFQMSLLDELPPPQLPAMKINLRSLMSNIEQ